jgi:hypothetical protein
MPIPGEPITNTVAGTVVKLVIERGAPAGFALVRSWLKGQTLMIVGPSRAGKTTFLDYLRLGVFQHEEEHRKTYKAVESPRFEVAIGPDKNLSVSIKKATDIPGQEVDPAGLVRAQRPHGLIVVLDVGTPDAQRESEKWLEEFLQRLDRNWNGQRVKKNRLKAIVIVLNKTDKLCPSDQSQSPGTVAIDVENELRSIVAREFKAARPPAVHYVPFKRCIMIANPEGTKWIDAVVVEIARTLEEAQH